MVTFIGCSDSQNSSNNEAYLAELQKNIDSNRALWLSANLEDYMFTYSATPSDCPTINPFPPVVITVEAGHITSVYVPAFNEYAPNKDNWKTIDELFDFMVSKVELKPLDFSLSSLNTSEMPEFNSVYGFPVNFYVNQTNNECDDSEHRVTGFQLQPANTPSLTELVGTTWESSWCGPAFSNQYSKHEITFNELTLDYLYKYYDQNCETLLSTELITRPHTIGEQLTVQSGVIAYEFDVTYSLSSDAGITILNIVYISNSNLYIGPSSCEHVDLANLSIDEIFDCQNRPSDFDFNHYYSQKI
jgi:hypothetical protein